MRPAYHRTLFSRHARCSCTGSHAIGDRYGLAGWWYVPDGVGSPLSRGSPRHAVRIDGFWIDRTPVTNRQFAEFVEATGHITTAEVAPNPDDYPGALPEMLFPGSLVFKPSDGPVDVRIGRSGGNFVSARTGGTLTVPKAASRN